jgi:WD40 repeat protein
VATLGAVTHGHLRHSDVGIWDAASGALQRSLRLSYGGSGHALAWSPDGLRLAATLGAQFEIWNAATGQKETDGTRSIGDRAGPEWLGWSSDGRFLAFVDRPRFESSATVTLWDVVAGKQTHSFPAVFQPGLLMSPAAWSPDGKRLAVVGKEITVWNADTGKEQFRLVGHDGRVVEVAWSPDGRRLISRSERANVRDNAYELRVWDMSRGDEIMVLRGESAGYVFSPQLQMLVVPVANDRESSSVLWDVRMPAKGSAGPNRRE